MSNKDDKNFKILLDILEKYDMNDIIKDFNVAKGTLKRWIDNKKIPKSYQFELIKLNSDNIDYSKYSYKDKDQFFTPTDISKYCYNKFKEVMQLYNISLNNYIYIEPSAGDGSFTKILPSNSVSLDIEPRYDKIIKKDFLKWEPDDISKKYITIGNPPFGLRGNLALRFINHSSKFSDHLCFLLPPLFESDGKGSPMKRVKNYNLIHSEKINTNFYDPGGKTIKINVILQIWSKLANNDKYNFQDTTVNSFKIYSLSDGGTPSSTRNKKMLNKCDIYLPSTCFGKNNVKIYDSFEDLPKRRGYGVLFFENKENNIKKSKELCWENIAFLSTNSAYNLRMSKISNALNSI